MGEKEAFKCFGALGVGMSKPDVDHSKEVDELLPQNTELATKHGKLAEAVENLLGLEKRSRLHNDWKSVERLCVGIVQICRQCNDNAALNENVVLLAKRRGQSKTSQTNMLKEACDILNEVQIETVASMERREKAEFVLEQMRLNLANGDFGRTQIVSKKLSEKLLNDESFEDVKVT